MVWETIASIEPIDHPDPVYDFTVSHADHNFVANGFVVSNCGVRLVRSNLFYREVKRHLRVLVDELFKRVPHRRRPHRQVPLHDHKELQHLLGQGSGYLRGRGLAEQRDIDYAEAEGRLDGADPSLVSDHAIKRGGLEQCGTLGSGNHFLEGQIVDHVVDEEAAGDMGLEKDMVCVMIHSGSRGLGYQVCDDALAALRRTPEKYGIELPDRQLACAPAQSPEGQHYIGAMRAAANFAWCNRQLLMMQAREVFADVFGRSWQEMQMNLRLRRLPQHRQAGRTHGRRSRRKKCGCIARAATRAFPPGHPEVPAMYRGIGQPVIIPGDMGRASWVLVGQPAQAWNEPSGQLATAAGRVLSRKAAVLAAGNRKIDKEMEADKASSRPCPGSRKGPGGGGAALFTRTSMTWWMSSIRLACRSEWRG